MKRLGIGLLAVLFSLSAYAAKNSHTVVLTETVQVGSTKLPAGPIKLTWTGTGSNAQLTLASKGETPVTVPVKIVAEKNNEPSVSTISINGAQVLQEVQLNDVTFVLQTPPTAVAGN
jgi:hypothetical protein